MTRAHDNDFPGRASEIEQQAAEWVTRIDLRGTPEEWAALDAWLNASPRHRAAFLRLSVAWRRADALKGLAPLSGAVDEDLLDPIRSRDEFTEDELLEGRAVSLDAHRAGARAEAAMQVEPAEAHADHQSNARPAPARAFRVVANNENIMPADMQWVATRRYRAGSGASNDAFAVHAANSSASAQASSSAWARMRAGTSSRLAASVAVLAVTGVAACAWYAVENYGVDTYSTHVGEFHRVTLEDGSTIAINTDSKVRVRYTDESRHIELVRGEALFDVAKNPSRPFDVEAGMATVRAVGTSFSVRLHEEPRSERVDVVVAEGRIAINPPDKETYVAGTVAIVRNGRVEATILPAEDITGRLAWTTGRLMFLDEKLGDVIAEINRYNDRKLFITDPDIAGLRIGGTYQATDPDGFAKALEHTFGIKSRLVSKPFREDVIRLDSGVP
jgi:ferric-dicitrate binding protein FerR (iron transport regulator)